MSKKNLKNWKKNGMITENINRPFSEIKKKLAGG